MPFIDRASLDPTERAALEMWTERQRTLEEVVRWGLLLRPPSLIVDVVVQDEYTHDVVMPYKNGLYLVYDTT